MGCSKTHVTTPQEREIQQTKYTCSLLVKVLSTLLPLKHCIVPTFTIKVDTAIRQDIEQFNEL